LSFLAHCMKAFNTNPLSNVLLLSVSNFVESVSFQSHLIAIIDCDRTRNFEEEYFVLFWFLVLYDFLLIKDYLILVF